MNSKPFGARRCPDGYGRARARAAAADARTAMSLSALQRDRCPFCQCASESVYLFEFRTAACVSSRRCLANTRRFQVLPVQRKDGSSRPFATDATPMLVAPDADAAAEGTTEDDEGASS